MEAVALRGRSRVLRGLAIAVVVFSSVLALFPDLSRNGGAAQPVFSRPNVRVDTAAQAADASMVGGPTVAVDAAGTLHAVWSDALTASDKGIFYAKSLDGGTTWTSELRIDQSTGSVNIAPAIAVDATGGVRDGNIYVVWQRGVTTNVESLFIESLDGGVTWVNLRTIETGPSGSPGMYPRIAVDSDGTLYVAYMAGTVGGYSIADAVSADGGVAWSIGQILQPSASFQGYQSIAAKGGLVCVAWEESTALSDGLWLAVSVDKGMTWTRKSIIAFGSGLQDASWVSVAVDDSGEIHAAWVAADDMGSSSVAYSHSKDRGQTWSVPAKVSDASSSMTYTAHSVTILASSGSLYAVWSDNRHGDYDVYASWSENDGATWGDGVPDNDVRVDDTDENGVTMDDASFQAASSAVKDRDGVYAVWSDNRNISTYNVYFSAFDLADVMITEIRDSPGGMEEVEIYNAVKANVDLTGWILEVDAMQISLSPIGTVGPNTYWTIGDPLSCAIPRDITLGDEGGVVRLLDSAGTEIDRAAYGQLGPVPDPIEGESVARVLVGASYHQAWIRAQTPSFGSMNGIRAPSSGTELVLNEVLFTASNPNDRFIEVHLNGMRALDIGGYVVAGDAAHTLPPVMLTDTDREFAFSPSDAPALFNLMDATGDNLYLYDPAGDLVDMVGWSSSHPQGTSMARVPSGSGSSSGYNDATSIAAGWMFDRYPSLPLVSVGPDQVGYANPGDRVYYAMIVKNKELVEAYVNVEALPTGEGWVANLLKSDGVTPLSDSPGDPDNTPDVGLLAPGGSNSFLVAVNVPLTSPGNESATTQIMVSIASDPMARSTATLKTILYPYESPTATASPSTIWVTDAPPACQPKESTIQLKVSGRGTPIFGGHAQDTIMVMDSSGSMLGSDPTRLRLAAAKHYVDLMKVPDRAAVVRFYDVAELVNGDHLSTDYELVKSDIDTITASGNTDIYDAIRISTDELLTRGDDDHMWVQILLTDGVDTTGHTNNMILGEAQRAASSNIKIFTIGLGDSADEALLQEIADMTDAIYLKADSAQDLDQIYQMIGNVTKAIAGYDNDVTDDIPMINVFLPDYVNYIPGSANPPPAYIGSYLGMTNLQWNVSQLKVAQIWTATLRITSDLEGYGERAIYYPMSKVTYLRHDDLRVNVPFPITLIDVLGAPVFPDLSVSISDIVVSPSPPFVEGEMVSVTATIHNSGKAPSVQTAATFHDGLPPAPQIGPSQPLNQMDPGLTQDVFTVWNALDAAPHTICVFADPGDLVVEENELNNIACVNVDVLPLPPTMPDYVPYLPEPDEQMRAALSATVTLSILVANEGNASASIGSTLAIGNLTEPPFALFTLPPLPESGTSARLIAEWMAPSIPGLYKVRARADYFDEIAEWDESNNDYLWTFEVVPGPVTSLVIGEPHYEAAHSYVTSSTSIGLSPDDRGGTGILFTNYRVDSAGWVNYTAQGCFHLHGDGAHVIDWYSVDLVGNREATESAVIVVDDTAPVMAMMPMDSPVPADTAFKLAADDGEGSGVKLLWISIDDAAFGPCDGPFTLQVGMHRLVYLSTDNLGNTGQQERIVHVLQRDVEPVVVRFNYKPTIAFLFSLLLVGAAALSARKRTLRRCKVPWMKFLVSWSLLALPFVLAEAVTGIVSVYFEPMRIPPIIGWGMAVDTLVLGVGVSMMLGRLAWRRKRNGTERDN